MYFGMIAIKWISSSTTIVVVVVVISLVKIERGETKRLNQTIQLDCIDDH